ncbi:MAG: hypothetical protein AAF690_18165 [Acidobacteriota bacterium]
MSWSRKVEWSFFSYLKPGSLSIRLWDDDHVQLERPGRTSLDSHQKLRLRRDEIPAVISSLKEFHKGPPEEEAES